MSSSTIIRRTNQTVALIAAVALFSLALMAGLLVVRESSTAHAEAMWANVTNGKFANALAASGPGADSWYPPRPGEPACVQVDVSNGASLTWCLKAKAAPDAPEVIIQSGTGDSNFVTTAWPIMYVDVTTYSSGTVSAWGVQGIR